LLYGYYGVASVDNIVTAAAYISSVVFIVMDAYTSLVLITDISIKEG
jgi:hypothetical protein